MSDRIWSIFEGGRKTVGPGGPFYATGNHDMYRFEIRFPEGYRASLPYGHTHEICYVPIKDSAIEEIQMHFPGFSCVRIVGRQLLKLYELLLDQQVSWIRERAKNEEVPGGSLCVEAIHYYQLTDWEYDFAARTARHDDLLAKKGVL